MEKRRSIPLRISQGAAVRGTQRVRILTALHAICRRIERMQQSEEAREACREVADLLIEARLREQKRPSSE
ncbi:MAG: hypothetical protein WC205_19145 [Opitutaceae bacterium]